MEQGSENGSGVEVSTWDLFEVSTWDLFYGTGLRNSGRFKIKL